MNRESLEKEMNQLVYNAGDGHPFARQMLDRAVEIHKILYPDPIAELHEEPVEDEPAIDITFDELFGDA